MRWNCFIQKRHDKKSNWHTWFAWYPINIGKTCIWLERVRRKGKYDADWGGGYWNYEYKVMEDNR